jgi:dTDP-4-dehydrorhamnose reductase
VRVVVTGGAGLVGRSVLGLAERAGATAVAPSSSELDVRDRSAVLGLLRAAAPDAVIHLAYRRAEHDTIVDGSAHVAEAARVVGARLVHLSSDAIFAGRPAPYPDDARPDPVHDYGRAKAAAEQVVAAADPAAVLVRTSIVYATDRLAPCQLDVLDALAGRTAMRFFTDEVRSVVEVDDLAAALWHLATRELDRSGTLNVAGPEPVDRAGFARLIAAWSGLDPGGVPTAVLEGSGLVRPGRVVLDTTVAERAGLGCRPVSAVLTPGAGVGFRPPTS